MYHKAIDIKVDKTLGYSYFMDKAHPLGDKKGRVWYHRHVASVGRGFWLHPNEVVHHKDGNRSNNLLENLVVVSSQSAHMMEHTTTLAPVECRECSRQFQPTKITSSFCSVVCSTQSKKLFDPTPTELRNMVWSIPTTEVAKVYGVSDSAVSKRCKKLGIEKPGRGYWSKREVRHGD